MRAFALCVPDSRGGSSRAPSRSWSARTAAGRRGTAAVEFALVAPAFVCLMMFIVELGYDLFAQSVLDFALLTSTRELQVGQAQGTTTMSQFQTQYFCPALRGLLPCSAVAVNVQSVTTDYYSIGTTASVPLNGGGKIDTSGYTFCPGGPGSLMLAQAIYQGPSIVGLFIPSMATPTASGPVHVTMSSVAYANENYPVTGAVSSC